MDRSRRVWGLVGFVRRLCTDDLLPGPQHHLPAVLRYVISSMLLSVVVALVLTPYSAPPCSSLWRKGHEARRPIRFCVPSSWLDRLFYRLRDTTCRSAARSRSQIRFVLRLCPIVVLMGYLFVRMPTAYLPDEDQGVLRRGPVAARLDREQTEMS